MRLCSHSRRSCWSSSQFNECRCPFPLCPPPAAALSLRKVRAGLATGCGRLTWPVASHSSAASECEAPSRMWMIWFAPHFQWLRQGLTVCNGMDSCPQSIKALDPALPAAATRVTMAITSRRAMQQSSSKACGKCPVSCLPPPSATPAMHLCMAAFPLLATTPVATNRVLPSVPWQSGG